MTMNTTCSTCHSSPINNFPMLLLFGSSSLNNCSPAPTISQTRWSLPPPHSKHRCRAAAPKYGWRLGFPNSGAGRPNLAVANPVSPNLDCPNLDCSNFSPNPAYRRAHRHCRHYRDFGTPNRAPGRNCVREYYGNHPICKGAEYSNLHIIASLVVKLCSMSPQENCCASYKNDPRP